MCVELPILIIDISPFHHREKQAITTNEVKAEKLKSILTCFIFTLFTFDMLFIERVWDYFTALLCNQYVFVLKYYIAVTINDLTSIFRQE